MTRLKPQQFHHIAIQMKDNDTAAVDQVHTQEWTQQFVASTHSNQIPIEDSLS